MKVMEIRIENSPEMIHLQGRSILLTVNLLGRLYS